MKRSTIHCYRQKMKALGLVVLEKTIFSLQERQASGIGRPAGRPSVTISKMNISEASRPILMKFDVNHQWVGGLIVSGFRADCITIVVSMATDSSHIRAMGKKP